MSRKKASFSQLIAYMNKESASPLTIGHNLYTHDRSTEQELIAEFEQNALHLPKRKNGNYLYHEVISFETNELSKEVMDEIIIEIGELYLSERAPSQLAYGVIHRDTDKPHIHFCISANDLGEEKRKRLTKAKFAQVQKNLEHYVQEKFPELGDRLIYDKARDNEKSKTTSREQELKKRTGRASKKDLLKNKLHGLFELANSHKELESLLDKEGYNIYTRGKNVGIEQVETGRKHRFTTLGVIEHYLSALERYDSLEKSKCQQAQSKESIQDMEQDRTAQQPEDTKQTTLEQNRVSTMKEADKAERQAEQDREDAQQGQEGIVGQTTQEAEALHDERATEESLPHDQEQWVTVEKQKQDRRQQNKPRHKQRKADKTEQHSKEKEKTTPLTENIRRGVPTEEKAPMKPQQKSKQQNRSSQSNSEKKTSQIHKKDYAQGKPKQPLKEKAKDFVSDRVKELDRLIKNKDKGKER